MKKILVAQSDPASLDLVWEVLSAGGYDVVLVRDGRAALLTVGDIRPDLVILDTQLQFFDGIAVVREIRRNPRFRNLPVVALTADAMRGDREKALEAGFDVYIPKPFNVRALPEQIERLLR